MTDYKLVNIVDSKLEDISSEITMPVVSGAKDNTFQNFLASTQTPTTVQITVSVPIVDIGMDREMLITSKMKLKVLFQGGKTAGYWKPDVTLFQYGYTNALSAFPFNALTTTKQAQINNTAVTVQSNDVMPALLKLMNYEELSKYNSLCPSLIDSFYQDYRDGIGSNNNVLGNYSNGGYSKEFQPRGVFPVKITDLSGNELPSYTIKADNHGTNPYGDGIFIEFVTTEPILFLSPFISGNSNNKAAFMGINKMNLTFQMNANGSYAMSNALYATNGSNTESATISNVQLVNLTDTYALCNFLSIPANLASKIPIKNVLNYNQYQAFKSANLAVIKTGMETRNGTGSQTLNQIPSKLLIYVIDESHTSYDSNYFLVIKSISVNFANKSGLLEGATQQQLFNMSMNNGLQMTYYEFSGESMSNNTDGEVVNVPTIGSIIVIDPAKDLGLSDQFSYMSKGSFAITCDVTYYNQTKKNITPTIYMTVVDSGVFMTENGTSIYNVGLLNQEQVLDTKAQEAITDTHSYSQEITGGSIENVNSIHKHLKKLFSRNSQKEAQVDTDRGESAGVMSAGAMSAGEMKKGRRLHNYM